MHETERLLLELHKHHFGPVSTSVFDATDCNRTHKKPIVHFLGDIIKAMKVLISQ